MKNKPTSKGDMKITYEGRVLTLEFNPSLREVWETFKSWLNDEPLIIKNVFPSKNHEK